MVSSTVFVVAQVALAALVAHVIYQCYFHPLARYPGPFLARFTNLWFVLNLAFIELRSTPFCLYGLPSELTDLHKGDCSPFLVVNIIFQSNICMINMAMLSA